MKEIYYIYNNEAIASCVFLSLLQELETIDLARACIMLPFLLDDKTVKYLQQFNDNEVNLDYIIRKEPRLFLSFNKRYLSLLPITINAITLLNKSNQIYITTEGIILKEKFSIDENDMGIRFNEIKKVLPIFIRLIKEYSTSQLYRILKIQL